MAGYAKQRSNWLDFPSTSTPILAANLNALETAIYELKHGAWTVQDPAEVMTIIPAVSQTAPLLRVLGAGHGSDAIRTDLGPNVLYSDTTMTGTGSSTASSRAYHFAATADDLNQSGGVSSKVEPFHVEHFYGGSNMQGGRNSLVSYSQLGSPSSASNADRNYVAIQGVWSATSGDGGSLPASPKGAGFGVSSLARMFSGATGFLNVTSGDFETVTHTSSSCKIQTGIQVGGSIGANGTVVDAVVYLGCGTGWGFTPIGYTTGFWIGNETGAPALASTGTVMKITGHSTLANGFDFTSTTFTNNLIASNGFLIAAPAGNHAIQLGRVDSVTSTPYIDFNSHGTAGVHDSRLIASGGDGTTAHGTLTLETGTFNVNGQLTSAPLLQVGGLTGQTGALQSWLVNNVAKLTVLSSGVVQTASGNESTGAGSAALGANSPAVTNTAPYKWLKFATSDGSTVYVPAWK